jgi:hypothetical protein
MEIEPGKTNGTNEVQSVKINVKSLFAGRTFGIGAKSESFKHKEVMSALDKQASIIEEKATYKKNKAKISSISFYKGN